MSTSSFTLVLNSDHGWVLLSAALVAFECILTGFFVAGRSRSRVFNKDFLEGHFGEEHFRATKQSIPRGGYPDMGNGRYAAKLSYGDWLDFNKAQRVHYNFVEQVASILAFIILGGIFHPVTAAIFGFIFCFGRIFYIFYVTDRGAEHPIRSIGAILCDIALLGGFILCVYSAVEVIQGNNDLSLNANTQQIQ